MKKFTIFIFSVLVISFGFCSSAFGATQDTVKVETKTNITNAHVTKILDKIDSTNLQIQDLIDKAISETSEISRQEAKDISELEDQRSKLQADSKGLEENVQEIDKITNKINDCKQEADYAIIKIMKELINVTDKIADNMMDEAAKYGIKVIQEYIQVTVDGVVYLVDPLRVGRS